MARTPSRSSGASSTDVEAPRTEYSGRRRLGRPPDGGHRARAYVDDDVGTQTGARPLGGIATTTPLTARSTGLAIRGTLLHDDGTSSEVELVVDAPARWAGRGPIQFRWSRSVPDVDGGELIWLVTTNKGWAHLRGVACAAGTGVEHPFRADIYAPRTVGHQGPARLALRLYAVGSDPNQASPIVKVQGVLDADGVQLTLEA